MFNKYRQRKKNKKKKWLEEKEIISEVVDNLMDKHEKIAHKLMIEKGLPVYSYFEEKWPEIEDEATEEIVKRLGY